MVESLAGLDDVQILVNLLGEELEVSYPVFSHFDFLSAYPNSEGYNLRIGVEEEDFLDLSGGGVDLGREVPSFSDFKDCLLSSGVLTYENVEEFRDYLKKKESTTSKPVVFCPDTNLLYQCFLSGFDGVDSSSVRIVETVKDEVKRSMNFKYGSQDLRELKEIIECHESLLNELGNKRMKKSRKASYLAMREFKRLDGEIIPAVSEITKDSEENDRIIVDSVKRFGEENSVEPILLTADDQITDICKMENLEHFYLKCPHELDSEFCSHEKFLKLITNLSLVFGVIKLNSIIIFGEFGGKGPDQPNQLKLKFLDEELHPEFKKHKKVCQNLSNLDIQK